MRERPVERPDGAQIAPFAGRRGVGLEDVLETLGDLELLGGNGAADQAEPPQPVEVAEGV